MHGLIFVTWEKYLAERFGSNLLHEYRKAIGETPATAPLANRVYDDATLLAGVEVATKLTHLSSEVVLREYGRYFIINGLTSHLCAYLLAQVHGGRELLLIMRQAHAQMHNIPDGLTPPIFLYEPLISDPKGLTLIYNSSRHLCPVLWGAIEGAGERYGERVHIVERTCMNRGASVCRFEIRFFSPTSGPLTPIETPEQVAQRRARQQLADIVFSILPDQEGMTLGDIQWVLQRRQVNANQMRPHALLEALNHLQHAGLVASTANRPGDQLVSRRYWRVPAVGQ